MIAWAGPTTSRGPASDVSSVTATSNNLFMFSLPRWLALGLLRRRRNIDALGARRRCEGKAVRGHRRVRLPVAQLERELRPAGHGLGGDDVAQRHRLRSVLDPDLIVDVLLGHRQVVRLDVA